MGAVYSYCELPTSYVKTQPGGKAKVEAARRMTAHILKSQQMLDTQVRWYLPKSETPVGAEVSQEFYLSFREGQTLGFFRDAAPDAIWLYVNVDAETIARTAAHELGHAYEHWFRVGDSKDYPENFSEDFAGVFEERFYEISDAWRHDDTSYFAYLAGRQFDTERRAEYERRIKQELDERWRKMAERVTTTRKASKIAASKPAPRFCAKPPDRMTQAEFEGHLAWLAEAAKREERAIREMRKQWGL